MNPPFEEHEGDAWHTLVQGNYQGGRAGRDYLAVGIGPPLDEKPGDIPVLSLQRPEKRRGLVGLVNGLYVGPLVKKVADLICSAQLGGLEEAVLELSR